jgi:poly(ADP-ribose) glycohydrolase ARH3
VFAGALLGTFVGDALGMPFEGAPPTAIPDLLEMQEARLGRGSYTDDTQMMIALAECLVEHGAVVEEDLASRFLDHCEPARGYGAGTLEVFSLWRRGVPAGEAATRIFGGEGSLGNGAAMRIAPLAVCFASDTERLIEQARRSARLTHAHPLGIDAAVVQAAAVAAAARGDDPHSHAAAVARSTVLVAKLERVSTLLHEDPAPARVAAEVGSSSAGHESVPAAIYACCAHDDFEPAVRFAVRCGGDTDTIGAMAGAIAGARDGASSIPSRWIEALEDGRRGRSYVLQVAGALVAAAA